MKSSYRKGFFFTDSNQNTKDNETIIPEKKQTKYSKAQARQRYKQGKI